jgi:hypothetical protein
MVRTAPFFFGECGRVLPGVSWNRREQRKQRIALFSLFPPVVILSDYDKGRTNAGKFAGAPPSLAMA